jgi:signal transduction histidine kinase
MTISRIYEVIGQMNISAKQLYNLLDNLLLWARIQRQTIYFNPSIFQLSKIIKDNIKKFKTEVRETNIEIINNVPDQLTVYCDVSMIDIIIRNILSNAIKFSNNSGKIHIYHADSNPGEHVTIIFNDEGLGIKKDILENLFKIDKRFNKQGTSQEEGSGLGLIICNELLDINGGSISIESESGKGCSVIITLPVKGPLY